MRNNGKKVLNKEQIQAIEHGKGPLLIIAGAGTGKTTVITERIKYLIEKNLAKPSEILALTFTEKEARLHANVDNDISFFLRPRITRRIASYWSQSKL